MKNFFLTLFTLFSFLINAQSTRRDLKPDPNSAQKKYGAASTQNLVNIVKHDTCLDKKFSIVFYLIQDSLYSLPIPTPPSVNSLASYSLANIITLLNNTFGRICVSFENCRTVIIPNYSHNEWKAFGNGNMITTTYFTDNTINVYIPTDIQPLYFDDPETAYSYSPVPGGPAAQRNAIVFQKTTLVDNYTSILHAFGIFFGLPHTFDEINPTIPPSGPLPPTNCTPPIKTLEYVDHTNMNDCKTHGDGFCDTEADPFPSALTVPSTIPSGSGQCITPGPTDGYNMPYVPPSDNIMSHYLTCRCRFTQEQYNHMAYIILTKRLYLH